MSQGPRRWLGVLAVAALVVAPGGCRAFDDFFSADLPDDDAFVLDLPDGAEEVDLLTGLGVGEACTPLGGGSSDCRLTLVCDDGICKAAGTTGEGQFCVLTDECAPGLHCGFTGTCEPSGDHAEGAACTLTAECEAGLGCALIGFSGVCTAPGEGDLGAECEAASACMAGLLCVDGACTAGNLAEGAAVWTGRSCDDGDLGPARVLFEVPREEDDLAAFEFFRLPHPTDVRRAGGGVDLTGFPTPGPGAVGFDPVERLVLGAAELQAGYGVVPAVYLRFSELVKTNTIEGNAGEATPRTLRFVDVTPGSPGYGFGPSYTWSYEPARGRYICGHWIALQVGWGSPLRPGTTYAVYLSDGVLTDDDQPFAADADFVAMLGAEAPEEAALAEAWETFAPLRAFLADTGEDPDTLIGGTVFTTEDTTVRLAAIREAVHTTVVPEPQDLTLCAGATGVGPCEDGLVGEDHVRGCPAEVRDDLWELHMRVAVPVVQAGTRPYLTPNHGGAVEVDGDGDVVLQGTEDVCVSLAVPKKTPMPEAGWSLALFGHGTGGTFRSGVDQVAPALAHVQTPDGDVLGVAVAAWEGPVHGDRRELDVDPEPLFYNFGNPAAGRGNAQQGAADVFALVRALAALDIAAEDSPTGEAIRFDADHLAFIGHSQGAAIGQIAAPYEPSLGLTVWSGAGAGLKLSMLHKTAPVDAAEGFAVALQEVGSEGTLTLEAEHPVLALLQDLFGPVDPVSHARLQLVTPLAEVGPQHVLHVYGMDDSYTPPPTLDVFARLLGAAQVEPVLEELSGLDLASTPLSGNVGVAGQIVTGGIVQVAPDEGRDGHFVLFDDPATAEQMARFVASWAAGAPVTIWAAEP